MLIMEKKQNQKQKFKSFYFWVFYSADIDWLIINLLSVWTFFSLRLWVFLPNKSVYCARLIYT